MCRQSDYRVLEEVPIIQFMKSYEIAFHKKAQYVPSI